MKDCLFICSILISLFDKQDIKIIAKPMGLKTNLKWYSYITSRLLEPKFFFQLLCDYAVCAVYAIYAVCVVCVNFSVAHVNKNRMFISAYAICVSNCTFIDIDIDGNFLATKIF